MSQGIPSHDIKGTDTLFFIQKSKFPTDRCKDVTYAQFVHDVRPHKKEKNRTQLVAGGDRVNYPGDCGTPTANFDSEIAT